jgi:hypothetical protein
MLCLQNLFGNDTMKAVQEFPAQGRDAAEGLAGVKLLARLRQGS